MDAVLDVPQIEYLEMERVGASDETKLFWLRLALVWTPDGRCPLAGARLLTWYARDDRSA